MASSNLKGLLIKIPNLQDGHKRSCSISLRLPKGRMPITPKNLTEFILNTVKGFDLTRLGCVLGNTLLIAEHPKYIVQPESIQKINESLWSAYDATEFERYKGRPLRLSSLDISTKNSGIVNTISCHKQGLYYLLSVLHCFLLSEDSFLKEHAVRIMVCFFKKSEIQDLQSIFSDNISELELWQPRYLLKRSKLGVYLSENPKFKEEYPIFDEKKSIKEKEKAGVSEHPPLTSTDKSLSLSDKDSPETKKPNKPIDNQPQQNSKNVPTGGHQYNTNTDVKDSGNFLKYDHINYSGVQGVPDGVDIGI